MYGRSINKIGQQNIYNIFNKNKIRVPMSLAHLVRDNAQYVAGVRTPDTSFIHL